MKPFTKKLLRAVITIVILALLTAVVIYFDIYKLNWLKPTLLVEQIPYEEVFEITGFDDAEFYDSKNEFIGAELRISVRFPSLLSPIEKLPEEYKKGGRKLFSNVDIYVKEVSNLKTLEKMREALQGTKHLRLIKDKEIHTIFIESKLDNKRVKRIKEISIKPDGYYFVKY